MHVLQELQLRSPLLYWFGLSNLALAMILILISLVRPIEFAGVNAWHKAIKFALSIGILSLTMDWFNAYLPQENGLRIGNWILVLSLTFEIIYITWQAARGQASHFNISTPLYSFLYGLMALGATLATLCVAYSGVLFFRGDFPALDPAYLWAIRLGILIFVIFSFEGFAMGATLSHHVGDAAGGKSIPFLNWSMKAGDLRVAHFVGMHALQVLPLLAKFVLRDTRFVVVAAILYLLLAAFILLQALQAKPALH